MTYIDHEIQAELESLNDAIRARLEIGSEAASQNDAYRAEEMICIRSRSLYSKYVDNVLWSGYSDPNVRQIVGDALSKATHSLTVNERCKQSVENRLHEFEAFSKRARALAVADS